MQQTSFKGIKEQTRLVGKVVHSELCKRLHFANANKWHIHKKETVLKNGNSRIYMRYMEVQSDKLTKAVRPDVIIVNKKKKKLSNL